MAIPCSCPECGYRYKVANDLAGESVLCPECQTRFTVEGKSRLRSRREEDFEDEDDRPRRWEDDEDDEDDGREKPVKGTGIPPWAWRAGTLACGLLVLAGIGIVAAVVAISPKASPGPAQNAPAAQGEQPPAPQAPLVPPADMTLGAFLAQRPDKPTKIEVNCTLASYYNFAYSGAAVTHYSVSLDQGGNTIKTGHAWVPKDSDAGKAVFEMLKDGERRRLFLEVILQGPDGVATPPGQEEMAVVRFFSPSGAVFGSPRPGGGTPPATDPSPVASLAGQALYAAYAANQAAADLAYAGKRVEVVETFRSQFHTPVKGRDGNYYLVFRDLAYWYRGKDAPEPTVVVHFRPSEVEALARPGGLRNGVDRLVMRGTCRGLGGGLIGYRDHVAIRDATLSFR
jgi:hypothetical protein